MLKGVFYWVVMTPIIMMLSIGAFITAPLLAAVALFAEDNKLY